MLGESQFEGNTSTMLGTVIHYIAEQVSQGRKVKKDDINKQILEYAEDKPDIDVNYIIDTYPTMAEELVNEYILTQNQPIAEYQTYTKVKDGIYVGGTVDAIYGDTIVDYKTTGKKPNTNSIPFHYKIQLLAYWKCLVNEGMEIDRIKLVYVTAPTKTLGPRVFTVTHTITHEDVDLIDNTLELIADTVLLSKKQPELNYLLFKSMSLKED
jgi:hypothetical protein